MATTAIRLNLSGSTNGKAIKLTGSALTLHTAVSSATRGSGGIWDEVWLWVFNSGTNKQSLNLQFGGTSSPDQESIEVINLKSGLTLICAGRIAQHSIVIQATGANTMTITGYVNRVTNA